jgi:hypothetical protein
MLFANTGHLAPDGTGASERSLAAIECKYNKNELLFISALQVVSLQVSAIFLLAGIAKSGCIAKSGECKKRCIRTGIRKKADQQLLVGNLPPPIQVHTSQVFLEPERHRMSFVHVHAQLLVCVH